MWRDLSGYAQRKRGAMREVICGYAVRIIQEAWPEERQARIPCMGVEWIDRFRVQLFAFEPTLELQKILHAETETLGVYNHMVEARRQRLDAVHTELPGVVWIVLLLGAIGCLLLSLFFPIEDARFQVILVAGPGGFIVRLQLSDG